MTGDFLRGLRVLDLGQYIPGPFATLMLGDFGAEVVKVEPPAGDPMRGFGPVGPGGTSPLYEALNAGKTVVRLDLKTEAGRAALADLLGAADVLMESYRPGTLARLGFGPDRLAALNPGLVHCALSGFGQRGPYAMRAGHDVTYVALSGGLALTGEGRGPVLPFPPVADHAGAMQATAAVLAALLRRERTGQGAHLDVSLFESALSWQYTAFNLGPTARAGGDLLDGGAAYYRVYETADGRHLAFGPIEPKFWQAFCAAVERPDLAGRQGEPLPQTDLIEELTRLFASRPLAEWVALLEPADCCAEPVLMPGEAKGLAHVAARGLVIEDDAAVQVLSPVFADGRPPPRRPARREIEAAEAVANWRR